MRIMAGRLNLGRQKLMSQPSVYSRTTFHIPAYSVGYSVLLAIC